MCLKLYSVGLYSKVREHVSFFFVMLIFFDEAWLSYHGTFVLRCCLLAGQYLKSKCKNLIYFKNSCYLPLLRRRDCSFIVCLTVPGTSQKVLQLFSHCVFKHFKLIFKEFFFKALFFFFFKASLIYLFIFGCKVGLQSPQLSYFPLNKEEENKFTFSYKGTALLLFGT